MRTIIISSLSLLVLAACGSTQSKDTAADGAKAAAEQPKPWTALETPEEKGAFMQDVVVPSIQELLRSHTGDATLEVTCKSCHGQDPQAVGFKMPTPDLPALNPEDFFAEHRAHNAEMVQFMAEQLTPKMVEVLGVEPYNPETHQGFGCFACHTMKQTPAPIPTADGEAEGEGEAAESVETTDVE